MSDLKRVVVITGASKGIGLALVQRFNSLGWQTAGCSRSEQIFSSGADFQTICDVKSQKDAQHFVEETLERFGRIDALINNAGVAGANSLEPDATPEASDDLWHEIIATNLHGTYYCSKAVLPHLPNHKGRIVNIASILALKGVPDQTAYTAAKHGVLGFTRALSHLLAPRGITVNAICPGWTRTDMAQGRMLELSLGEAQLKAGVPLGDFVEPAEVAELASILVNSAAGSKITGQALTIDGGFLA